MSTASGDQEESGGLRAGIRKALARLHGGDLTARRLGFSVALGLFVGCSPLYGLHGLIVGGIAFLLRLDVLIAYLASNISLPPLIPVLLFAEVQVGSYLLRGRFLSLSLSEITPDKALDLSAALSVGFLVVGTLVAILGGAAAYAVGLRMERRRGQRSPVLDVDGVMPRSLEGSVDEEEPPSR